MNRVASLAIALDGALTRRLATMPARAALCALMAGIFLFAAAVRLYPFVDDVTAERAAGDDWLTYKLQALSILQDGITMPAVAGNYTVPGGFLYNYFVAAVFALFGVNAAYVYLTQAALLGLSIATMFLVFRPRLPPGAGVVYLGTLTAFLSIDAFLKYTVRLLSENLLLLILPLFFWCALHALERGRLPDALAAGAVLGVAALTRPNVVFLGPGVAVLLAVWLRRQGRPWLGVVAGFLCALGVVFSLMALRNYAVTGEISFATFTHRKSWSRPSVDLTGASPAGQIARTMGAYAAHYARRLLYCAGFLFVEDAKYPLLPHWVLMWLGVGTFVVDRVRRGRLAPWESLMLVFLVFYLGPLVAIAKITNYGVRMIMPAVPAALVLAVRGLADRWSAASDEVLSR